MFDEIKKTVDEIEKMELEVKKKEQEMVSELEDEYGVIGVRKSGGDYTAQVYEFERLLDIADGEKINVVMRNDVFFPYELELVLEGVKFFKILTKEDYELYLEEYADVDVTEYEPEEARARLTEYERGLRDSGHIQSDFL